MHAYEYPHRLSRSRQSCRSNPTPRHCSSSSLRLCERQASPRLYTIYRHIDLYTPRHVTARHHHAPQPSVRPGLAWFDPLRDMRSRMHACIQGQMDWHKHTTTPTCRLCAHSHVSPHRNAQSHRCRCVRGSHTHTHTHTHTGPTRCLRRLFCSAAPEAATDCRPESPARRPVPATETAANQLRVRGAAVKACTEGPRSTRRHALAQGIHSALVALSPRLQLPFRSQWRETSGKRHPIYVASRYFQ